MRKQNAKHEFVPMIKFPQPPPWALLIPTIEMLLPRIEMTEEFPADPAPVMWINTILSLCGKKMLFRLYCDNDLDFDNATFVIMASEDGGVIFFERVNVSLESRDEREKVYISEEIWLHGIPASYFRRDADRLYVKAWWGGGVSGHEEMSFTFPLLI